MHQRGQLQRQLQEWQFHDMPRRAEGLRRGVLTARSALRPIAWSRPGERVCGALTTRTRALQPSCPSSTSCPSSLSSASCRRSPGRGRESLPLFPLDGDDAALLDAVDAGLADEHAEDLREGGLVADEGERARRGGDAEEGDEIDGIAPGESSATALISPSVSITAAMISAVCTARTRGSSRSSPGGASSACGRDARRGGSWSGLFR